MSFQIKRKLPVRLEVEVKRTGYKKFSLISVEGGWISKAILYLSLQRWRNKLCKFN